MDAPVLADLAEQCVKFSASMGRAGMDFRGLEVENTFIIKTYFISLTIVFVFVFKN